MREIDDLKRQAIAEVDRWAPSLWEAAQTIGRNPELGHQEHKSVATLTGLLTEGGIESEIGIAGLATAWRARIGSGGARPSRSWPSSTPCRTSGTAAATT